MSNPTRTICVAIARKQETQAPAVPSRRIPVAIAPVVNLKVSECAERIEPKSSDSVSRSSNECDRQGSISILTLSSTRSERWRRTQRGRSSSHRALSSNERSDANVDERERGASVLWRSFQTRELNEGWAWAYSWGYGLSCSSCVARLRPGSGGVLAGIHVLMLHSRGQVH